MKKKRKSKIEILCSSDISYRSCAFWVGLGNSRAITVELRKKPEPERSGTKNGNQNWKPKRNQKPRNFYND